MRRFYSKFRITLLTFTFGLASVWMFNGLKSKEISVELPQVQSKSPIMFFKIKEPTSKFLSGGSGGNPCETRKCEKVKIAVSFE